MLIAMSGQVEDEKKEWKAQAKRELGDRYGDFKKHRDRALQMHVCKPCLRKLLCVCFICRVAGQRSFLEEGQG